jgi:hypothetical protein
MAYGRPKIDGLDHAFPARLILEIRHTPAPARWAEECFGWARAASDDSAREQYASLGQVWLEQAARAELLSGMAESGLTKPRLAAIK